MSLKRLVKISPMLVLMIIITGYSGVAMSEEDLKKDMAGSQSVDVDGAVLEFWAVCYENLSQQKKAEIRDYRITFSDHDDRFEVFFKRKSTGMVLGGGHGKCVIDKVTRQVREMSFGR